MVGAGAAARRPRGFPGRNDAFLRERVLCLTDGKRATSALYFFRRGCLPRFHGATEPGIDRLVKKTCFFRQGRVSS